MTAQNVYSLHIKPRIPKRLHKLAAQVWYQLLDRYFLWRISRWPACLNGLHARYYLWRVGRRPTRFFGPLWRRSAERVEIDITYSCNLKCFNCNRSCEQDPSNDRMSIAQVRQFLEESRAAGNPWKAIQVLGGEPTNHPQFVEIMNLIVEYRDKYSTKTSIQLNTNGYGERVNRMLSRVPAGVTIKNSSKTTKAQTEFCTFNVAPIDLEEYAGADYANGCFVSQICGSGVTPYGYYPCAIAGAIDRTFGLNMGRKTLPEPNDAMIQELRVFCALCGHFKPPTSEELPGPVMSPTWVEAYTRSHRCPPKLSRLPEQVELSQIGR